METIGLLVLALAALGVFIIGALVIAGLTTLGLLLFTKIGRSVLIGAITDKVMHMIFGTKGIRFKRRKKG